MRELERYVILQVVDTRWREHLENMDYLREGVHLRAFAQKDPLVEYRGEGHTMFEELGLQIREEVVGTLFHAQLAPQDADGARAAGASRTAAASRTSTRRLPARTRSPARRLGGGAVATGRHAWHPPGRSNTQQASSNENQKLGRNDPCWCGSGKKFKKCHGA